MKQLLSEVSKATLNLVFPIYCQGCEARLSYNSKIYLCQSCFKKIKLNTPPFCVRCGRAMAGSKDLKTVCPFCLNKKYNFDAAWQCCEYEGLMEDLIHSLKYKRSLFLKDTLADILCGFAGKYIDYKRIELIMPVPMHKVNLNNRGFNQAALLSQALSKALGIDYDGASLIKVKKTAQQALLKREDRLSNLKDAFSVREDADIKGKSLLLVDDVFTTGATVNECSKALNDAGAKTVWALALARGKVTKIP